MENKQQNSVKLIRGQKGNFGWEIKLIGEDETDIKKRLDILNKSMIESYDLKNQEVNK